MRRLVPWFAGALVLCLAAGGALAQQTDQGQTKQQNIPPTVKVATQDANRPAEPNRHAAMPNPEQLRQKTRERMREHVKERREMGSRGQMNPRRTTDINALAGVKGKMKDRGAAPGEKPAVVSAEHQQQLEMIEQQISHEEAKHRDRLARLNRIRELAQQQGDTEKVARVDNLFPEEQRRYDMKMNIMDRGKKTIIELSQQPASDSNSEVPMRRNKGRKKIDAGKARDANQPLVEKNK
jgi:hypothetical protein